MIRPKTTLELVINICDLADTKCICGANGFDVCCLRCRATMAAKNIRRSIEFNAGCLHIPLEVDYEKDG